MLITLKSVLEETRLLLMRPGNDFSRCCWDDAEDAVSDLTSLAGDLDAHLVPRQALVVLFGPTGPLQEISARSGWAEEFIGLNERFNDALARSDLSVMRDHPDVSSPDLAAPNSQRTA
jgi:hypothetical protein